MDSIDNAVVKRQLPCQLTHMEVADAAMLAATRQGEYDKVEEEKKRVLGRYTHRLKSLRAEMSIESKKATTGVEDRFVECVWCVDRERCKAVLRRTDSQEIIQERELTKSDIQLTMTELMQFLEENAESPAAAVESEDEADEEGSDTVELFSPMIADAARFIVDQGAATTAVLQRQFNIGYTRAAAIMEQLERMEIVGPLDGSDPRKILVTPEDLDDMFPDTGELEEAATPTEEAVNDFLKDEEAEPPMKAEDCPINPRRAEILARDGV